MKTLNLILKRCSRTYTWACIIIICPSPIWLIIFLREDSNQTSSTIEAWHAVYTIERTITTVPAVVIIICWWSRLHTPEKCFSITAQVFRISEWVFWINLLSTAAINSSWFVKLPLQKSVFGIIISVFLSIYRIKWGFSKMGVTSWIKSMSESEILLFMI